MVGQREQMEREVPVQLKGWLEQQTRYHFDMWKARRNGWERADGRKRDV
jgi:hypothetical protein